MSKQCRRDIVDAGCILYIYRRRGHEGPVLLSLSLTLSLFLSGGMVASADVSFVVCASQAPGDAPGPYCCRCIRLLSPTFSLFFFLFYPISISLPPFWRTCFTGPRHGYALVDLNRSMGTALEIGSIARHPAVGAPPLSRFGDLSAFLSPCKGARSVRSSKRRARERYVARSISRLVPDIVDRLASLVPDRFTARLTMKSSKKKKRKG